MALTPLGLLGYLAILGLVYWSKRVSWQRFHDRQRARFSKILGEDPERLQRVVREVDALLETDPAAAAALLHSRLRPQLDREKVQRAELWEQALNHREAAADLRRRLSDDLESYSLARSEMARRAIRDPRVADVVQELNDAIARTKRELGRLGQLPGGEPPISDRAV